MPVCMSVPSRVTRPPSRARGGWGAASRGRARQCAPVSGGFQPGEPTRRGSASLTRGANRGPGDGDLTLHAGRATRVRRPLPACGLRERRRLVFSGSNLYRRRQARTIPHIVRRALTLAGLVVGAAFLLAAAGSPRGIKEGGTFRLGVTGGFPAIDPAIFPQYLLRPACAGLLNTPQKPVPAGLRFEPELAADYPVVSSDRRPTRSRSGRERASRTARLFWHATCALARAGVHAGHAITRRPGSHRHRRSEEDA